MPAPRDIWFDTNLLEQEGEGEASVLFHAQKMRILRIDIEVIYLRQSNDIEVVQSHWHPDTPSRFSGRENLIHWVRKIVFQLIRADMANLIQICVTQ